MLKLIITDFDLVRHVQFDKNLNLKPTRLTLNLVVLPFKR